MVFPECSRNLFKVTASRAHWQIKNEVFHFDIAEAPRKLSKVTIKKESTHNVMDRFLYCRFAEDRHSHASTPLTT